jgi:hypothetical protein
MHDSKQESMARPIELEPALGRCFYRRDMRCICGATSEIGVLCRACALEVEPCDGLIPDHVHSRVDPRDGGAWVVDGFGGAHAIAATTAIGRNFECELVVLAGSVSRDHAELRCTETGWIIRDLGSRNGTFVDGGRIQSATALPARARLRVGDVALWFLAEAMAEPPERLAMATGGMSGGLIRYQVVHGEIELSVVIGDDQLTGGALLWRPIGAERWAERSLAPLEFQLLRALCIRGCEEAASPSPIRGCVPTKRLARELPFQSRYANQENVRQVVLRLRGVLGDVGAHGVLAVAPGRGYYLAGSVTLTSHDTRMLPRIADRPQVVRSE